MRHKMPARRLSAGIRQRVRAAFLFVSVSTGVGGWCQSPATVTHNLHPDHRSGLKIDVPGAEPDPEAVPHPWWEGLSVKEISFDGVPADRLQSLARNLPQEIGAPLDREKVAKSIRDLYASGLFDSIQADASREADGVRLIFRGRPRQFIGAVSVIGAKGATINAQLQAAARLNAGTRFSQTRLKAAIERMRQTLADNGFNEP